MATRPPKPYSAPPFSLLHSGDNGAVTLDVPGFRQARNYSCGYAAVLMVLRYFDRTIGGQELFEALGTARDGTGQSAIIRVLRSQGLSANPRYDADFARISRTIRRGKVMIGYLTDEEHWVVLYGVSCAPEGVFVADPEPGKTTFLHRWDTYGPRLGGFALVCSPSRKRMRVPLSSGACSAFEPQQLALPGLG